MKSIKVLVLFGGKSGEHEISLISASSIIRNIPKDKYDLYTIGITKEGRWLYFDGSPDEIEDGSWERNSKPAILPPDPSFKGFFLLDNPGKLFPVDLVFPVLHGPMGEDGTIQGLLEMSMLPYVGCGVLSSSLAMDKLMAKALFASENISQGEYLGLRRQDIIDDLYNQIHRIEDSFSYPIFIKPANMGSSVGISKARSSEELEKALYLACEYDERIIAEEFIDGREIECAVLGNDKPKASILGEILPSKDFYDYEAKYEDGDKSKLIIPADLDDDKMEEIKEMALLAYSLLDCRGLARVDFFLEKNTQRVLINEINTMPGFTNISMYPKLWEASGIAYDDLIDRLIELALERYDVKHNFLGGLDG